MINQQTPYANLDPNLILEAVDSLGLRCSGSLLALNSYENRVYQVGIEDSPPFIAKFYRPERWSNEAILEEHQFAIELVEHEIPIVAPWQSINDTTLHQFKDYRFALFPRWGGRALELDSFEQLEWMGRFIGRLHAIGATKPFLHRPTLSVANHGFAAYLFLIEHFIPNYLKDRYINVAETALERVKQRFQYAGSLQTIRLHGDMHPGNVLWNDAGPHIVDLDDCLIGPAMQDIWMMLSGNLQQMRVQLDYILNGYHDFFDFNLREITLIEALRTLRQIHYSGWLAKRWQDPAFPLNFPWFNTPHYWEEQITNLQEQIQLMDEDILI